jgi:hypothetical protein
MTADHGHVVERRQGIQRPYPGISSGRSCPATGSVEAGLVGHTGMKDLPHRPVSVHPDTLAENFWELYSKRTRPRSSPAASGTEPGNRSGVSVTTR